MSSEQPIVSTTEAKSHLSNLEPGMVKTISKTIHTDLQPVEIFQRLNQSQSIENIILLETTDIQSNSTEDTRSKSIFMTQAAIRIECNGQNVKLDALTVNGNNALKQISQNLKNGPEKLELNQNSSSLDSLQVEYSQHSTSTDEDTKLKRSSPIDILRTIRDSFKLTQKSEYSIFLTGIFSYDFIAIYEKLPEVEFGTNTCPDFVYYLAESLLVVDHQRNSKRYMCNHFTTPLLTVEEQQKTYFDLSRSFEMFEQKLETKSSKQEIDLAKTALKASKDFCVDIRDETYKASVDKLKQNICNGDVFQVVPSRTFSIPCLSPIDSYKTLKKTNPSPYLFYMQDQDFIVFGASPESALKYTKSTNKVELYPIAGTRPRGKDTQGNIDIDLDIRIETELKLDSKEISEHMMLVDLARNDIARISTPGTIAVTKLLEVDKYSQVMHLVSNVQGELLKNLDALHAYQACMNMGTLTGAPKLKATELLRETEGTRRGSYGGAVGYLNGNGDMDTCIVIRSAFYKNGIAHIQAGAGIVYDSVPELEAQETTNKAMAVINAVRVSNQLITGEIA